RGVLESPSRTGGAGRERGASGVAASRAARTRRARRIAPHPTHAPRQVVRHGVRARVHAPASFFRKVRRARTALDLLAGLCRLRRPEPSRGSVLLAAVLPARSEATPQRFLNQPLN